MPRTCDRRWWCVAYQAGISRGLPEISQHRSTLTARPATRSNSDACKLRLSSVKRPSHGAAEGGRGRLWAVPVNAKRKVERSNRSDRILIESYHQIFIFDIRNGVSSVFQALPSVRVVWRAGRFCGRSATVGGEGAGGDTTTERGGCVVGRHRRRACCVCRARVRAVCCACCAVVACRTKS